MAYHHNSKPATYKSAVQHLPCLCFVAVLIPNHSKEINSSIDNTNNRLRAVDLLFFLAKLLHAEPKQARGKPR